MSYAVVAWEYMIQYGGYYLFSNLSFFSYTLDICCVTHNYVFIRKETDAPQVPAHNVPGNKTRTVITYHLNLSDSENIYLWAIRF